MSALIASDLPRQVISFSLNNQEFALDLRVMQEVVPLPTISPLMQAPEFVPGVINLRGAIVPLIDLRRRLGLPPVRYSLKTVVLICQLRDDRWGLVVDEVSDILDLPVEAWTHLPEKLDETRHGTLLGIANLQNQLVFVLHGQALVAGTPAPPDHLLEGEATYITPALPPWAHPVSPNLLTGGGPPRPAEGQP